MPRKSLILSVIALVVVLGVSYFTWSFFNQPQTETPKYLPLTASLAPLKTKDEVKLTAEANPANNLSSPEASNAFQIVQTETGNMLLLAKENQVVPVEKVIQGNWADEETILIVSGTVQAPQFDPNKPSQPLEVKITGEKGLYLYNIRTQEKKLLYTMPDEAKSFSAQTKDGFIIVCTGFSIEKLDKQGNYLTTLYKHDKQNETLFLTNLANSPKGQVEFNINKGTEMETKTVSLG